MVFSDFYGSMGEQHVLFPFFFFFFLFLSGKLYYFIVVPMSHLIMLFLLSSKKNRFTLNARDWVTGENK